MSWRPPLFDRDLLLTGLAVLDRRLHERGRPHQALIVVGGSYMALAELRESTRDVDTLTRLDDATRTAIDEVAAELDLPKGWLNDHAAGFAPEGMTTGHCRPAFEGRALAVLVPSADWVFLMKMYAGRLVDRPDLVRLWPETGFASPADAVARYWAAYPYAPEDDFLEGFVANIVDQVGSPSS